MVKKRIEKLEDAFPDFFDEEENSLDQILDDITAQKKQEKNEQISPENALQRVDDFYEEKISETCEDILLLEKNATTLIQADIENLYKGSFVRDYAKRYQISEKEAKERLREELADQLQTLGMNCVDKKHYALPREIKHIIRMDFYGTIDRIDEKLDSKSAKKLSPIYLNRNPQKTKDLKPADYDLKKSHTWMIYRQFRSFRLLERNLPEILIQAGISPDDFARLNAYDISQVLYNHYIHKSKPDAEKDERANLFLGAKYRFVKAFIRRNKTAFKRIMDLRGVDPRYTDTLIKHMEQYGITTGFDVVEKNYSAEMLSVLKKHKLIPEDTKIGAPIKEEQISKIKEAGLIGVILARDENGNPVTGPELNIHHKIAVQDSGEKTNFAEVNQFKNLCLIIEPYHFFAHALDRTQNVDGAERYVSRIEIDENIAFFGGFNKIFQAECDFGRPHYNEYDHEILNQIHQKDSSSNKNQSNTSEKISRKQKKKEKLQQQKQIEQALNSSKTPKAKKAKKKTKETAKPAPNTDKDNKKMQGLSKRIDKLSLKKDEYNRIRAELIEKRKQYLSLRAAKKSAIKTISQFEDDEKFERFIQYTIKMQEKQR